MGDVPTWLAAIAAFLAVAVAYWQLSGLNDTLRINGLMAVLQIESELNARKHQMAEVATRLEMECSRIPSRQKPKLIVSLSKQLNACLENYLNAVDRLAFCILKDYVPEKDWRAEYRECMASDIESYPEFFGPSSRYRNIKDLHDKWQRT
jgi:hypothetical protein